MTEAVFAIPGDPDQRTGGYIYETSVLRSLNQVGCATELMRLPDSFPAPTPDDMVQTIGLLQQVPSERVIILDGFLVGALDPAAIAEIKAPMVGVVHHPLGLETGLSADRAAFLMRNEAAVLRQINHVVVPSPHTRQILIQGFNVPAEKITVALPGFLQPHVDPTPVDPPLILSVGLLVPRKGHDVLIEALSKITDLDWQAAIVGKQHAPRLAEALADRCKTLGLKEKIRFTGELTEKALNNWFNAASIFALATRYEGYGMVLSEAMMFGLPIVSCRTGAVPDTLGDAGLPVPVDDPDAFAAALRNILTNAELRSRLKGAAQARAASLPTWLETARQIATTIRNASTDNAVPARKGLKPKA